MTKYHIDETVAREKARLVVKGFTQVYDADYDETYAPVGSYVTLRIFLNIVAVLNQHLMQLYMKNAFLQSKLDRVLDEVLTGAKWKNSQVDEVLYFKVGNDGVTCWVLVYVDDLLAASSSTAMLRELKELLEAAFELRETPVSFDAYGKLTFDDEDAQARKEEEYRQKVSSLQFAATTMRSDIAFACSKLGSSLTVRSNQHWCEVDCCLAYLADTPEPDEHGRLHIRLGGAAVSWSSQRIKCATLSLTESEYMAAIEVGKEECQLCFLLADFQLLDPGMPTVLWVDNTSAITVAEGLGLKGNLKHMEQRYAWLQQMVKRGKFVLRYIPTTEQPTEFLMKALHFPAFN
ncbi:unnamed protein product, partial [Closterium sp. NIES-53]